MKITEGYMPYLEYKTYYRIVGECTGNKKPLVLLHGGPGSTHNYFEVLDKVAEDGRAVIMYDQLGCGLSSTPSRPDLWNAKTWIEELIQLRKHLGLDEIHLLGQSWEECKQFNMLVNTNQKESKAISYPVLYQPLHYGKKNNVEELHTFHKKCKMPLQKQKKLEIIPQKNIKKQKQNLCFVTVQAQ